MSAVRAHLLALSPGSCPFPLSLYPALSGLAVSVISCLDPLGEARSVKRLGAHAWLLAFY